MRAAIIALAVLIVAQAIVFAFLLIPRAVADGKAVGAVVVTSSPSGATVHVDDVEVGTTPYKGEVAPGAHRISVKQGDASWSAEVAVTKDAAAAVHVAWPVGRTGRSGGARPGTLRINTEPPGAQVSVDGQSRGIAPVEVGNLAPGRHRVTVTGSNGPTTRTVSVSAGETSTLLISASAPSRAGVASGWLSIVIPVSARIYERGALVGTSETPRIMVPAGQHQLEIVNATLGLKVQRSVQVVEGQTAVIDVEVPKGVVAINALPWADVSVGSRALGQTPLANVSLPIGSHELVFRHPELGERRKTVVVTALEKARIGIDMRKE